MSSFGSGLTTAANEIACGYTVVYAFCGSTSTYQLTVYTNSATSLAAVRRFVLYCPC